MEGCRCGNHSFSRVLCLRNNWLVLDDPCLECDVSLCFVWEPFQTQLLPHLITRGAALNAKRLGVLSLTADLQCLTKRSCYVSILHSNFLILSLSLFQQGCCMNRVLWSLPRVTPYSSRPRDFVRLREGLRGSRELVYSLSLLPDWDLCSIGPS